MVIRHVYTDTLTGRDKLTHKSYTIPPNRQSPCHHSFFSILFFFRFFFHFLIFWTMVFCSPGTQCVLIKRGLDEVSPEMRFDVLFITSIYQ